MHLRSASSSVLRQVNASLLPPRRHVAVRVAAIEEQQASDRVPQQPEPTLQRAPLPQLGQWEEADEELELVELDSAQEQLLAWMVNQTHADQEHDLDEMVDYDEFGDDEYEELTQEVQLLMESSGTDLRIGDKVVGTVYEVDDEGAYVEIGQKASGFVPLSECSFAKLKTPLEVLRVGMTREFLVVDREDEYGQTVLSLGAVEAGVFWQRIRQLHEEEHTVSVTVESANRGGLLVRYGPYEGFVPVSQFGPMINVDNMESLIGQDIPVKFLEVDEERERLVFSNKRATAGLIAGADAPAYKIGDVAVGVVQSIKPYGAFVDLGGMTGLLHLSQISAERVTSVDKVLREGEKIKVMILSMDTARGRVTLSTRRLEPSPGDMLTNPQLCFDKAEEMAALFRIRLEQSEQQMAQQEGLNQ